MHNSQVNTGTERTDHIGRGSISKDEIREFRRITWPGKKLICRYPRRRGDEEVRIGKMTVLKQYPFIVTLEYAGACGTMFKTSMTWAEAIILNWRPCKK